MNYFERLLEEKSKLDNSYDYFTQWEYDKKLYEDADVYLLDEPERSLGNTFINSVIVPRIVELGKMGKTVIIATHNANIAVRTLPFTSILKALSIVSINNAQFPEFTPAIISSKVETIFTLF